MRFTLKNTLVACALSLVITNTYADDSQNTKDTALDEFSVGQSIYVADDVKVWTRSGPSTNYRVTGYKIPGDEMKFIRYSSDKKFAELSYKNDTFWMSVDNLQANSSGYTKEEMYKSRIKELEDKLLNYDNELSRDLKSANKKLEKLIKQNEGMKVAISQKDETISNLDEMRRDYEDRLNTKELDMQMRWWTQGAIIALCGALVGAIFIFIPRPTKSRRRERF